MPVSVLALCGCCGMPLKTLLVALVLFFGPLGMLGAGPAGSQPLDLQNPRPRWVSVRFERSPAESPGQLDSEYSPRFAARFEPGPKGERVRVIVQSDVVERHLFRDHTPVVDSFSDFVWDFDVATGHVISASVSGALSREIRWGFLRTSTEVRVRVEMSTLRRTGFRHASTLFGNTLHRACQEPDTSDCTLVGPQRLDRETGYVNAVGELVVDSVVSRVRSFSPLGEAVFEELVEFAEPFEAGDRVEAIKPVELVELVELVERAEPANPPHSWSSELSGLSGLSGQRRSEASGSVIDFGSLAGSPGALQTPSPSASTKIGLLNAKGVKPGAMAP